MMSVTIFYKLFIQLYLFLRLFDLSLRVSFSLLVDLDKSVNLIPCFIFKYWLSWPPFITLRLRAALSILLLASDLLFGLPLSKLKSLLIFNISDFVFCFVPVARVIYIELEGCFY
jgi:hypothetical protein